MLTEINMDTQATLELDDQRRIKQLIKIHKKFLKGHRE